MNRSHAFAFVGLATLALAACSTGGNSTNNNPLAGVTIVQPASPSPSPTPSPFVPTPTPAPSSTDAIADPGFESGGFTAGWTQCSIPRVLVGSTAAPFPTVAPGSVGAAIVKSSSPSFEESPSPAVTPAIHSGTYSALTYSGAGASSTYGGGPKGLNGVCQTFTVPADASLTMYVNEGASDTGLKYADQEADIVTSGGTIINLFQELNGIVYNGGGGSWVEKGPYVLTGAPYNLTPGQSVMFFAGSFDSDPDATYGVYMFVDDVNVIGTESGSSAAHRNIRLNLGPGPRR